MDQILRWPKHVLALVVIGAGMLLIILWEPPVTICGQQVRAFENEAKELLPPKGPSGTSGPSGSSGGGAAGASQFERLRVVCLEANSIGGCLQFFAIIKQNIDRAKLLSLECLPKLSGSSLFDRFSKQSLDTVVKVAWLGGWFEGPQFNLFCRLQDIHILVYGEARWAQTREEYLQSLPGAKDLSREDAWRKSVFAVNCAALP
jgi:hypothetical protein